MTAHTADRWVDRAARMYGWCLLLYPRAIRHHYRRQVMVTFRDTARGAFAAGGWRRMIGAWLRMFGDAFVNGPRERLADLRKQSRRTTGARGPRTPRLTDGLVDVRYAVRALRRSPGFAAVAVVTLALGVGANAAIFSVVHHVLLRPLPYGAPGELAWISMAFAGHGGGGAVREFPASEPEYLEYREASAAFSDIAGYWTSEVNFGGANEPERLRAAWVTANFFDVLRVAPVLGRGFAENEDRPGAAPVVVLSHGVWQRAFGTADVVGTDVLVNGQPATVIGVLPPSFTFPGAQVDIVRTNTIDPANPAGRSSHYLRLVGRLVGGVEIESARAEIDGLIARWEIEYPQRHGLSAGHPLVVSSLHERIVGDVRITLLVLSGAVALVFLIACANVASLMLVRAEHRQTEMSIRSALGAGKGRVMTHLLSESAALGAAGGALGAVVAALSVWWLRLFGPGDVPRLDQVRVDGIVLVFTALISLLAALLFGIVPALRAVQRNTAEVVREGGGSTSSRRRLTFRSGLVVGEVALAVMLVAGAGVLVKSVSRLLNVDPGFDGDGVVAVDFSLNSAWYPEQSDIAAFHTALVERVETVPGVLAAGAVRALPLYAGAGLESLNLIGRQRVEEESWNAGLQVVSPGYFDALRIPVVQGRVIQPTDGPAGAAVVVINETMSRTLWPAGDALGKQIRVGRFPDNVHPIMTIVGVVGDVRQSGLDRAPVPQIFIPRQQAGVIYNGYATRSATFVVRSDLTPAAIMNTLRAVIREMDPNLPLANMQTMDDVVSRSVAERRFVGSLMGAFSVVALVLGAVGVYGLMAYSVARRTREFGLRIALGASGGRVLGLVVRQAVHLAAAGVICGMIGAWVASRFLIGFMYETSVRDPLVFLAAPAVLVGVSLVAAYLPAARAAAVPPMAAMRTD